MTYDEVRVVTVYMPGLAFADISDRDLIRVLNICI